LFKNLSKEDAKFDDLSLEEFSAKLKNQINYGLNVLDQQSRTAMIEKGRAACQYLEDVTIYLWHDLYKKQQQPFPKFCYFELFMHDLLSPKSNLWADCKDTHDKIIEILEPEYAQ
jgi:hypothetical protein